MVPHRESPGVRGWYSTDFGAGLTRHLVADSLSATPGKNLSALLVRPGDGHDPLRSERRKRRTTRPQDARQDQEPAFEVGGSGPHETHPLYSRSAESLVAADGIDTGIDAMISSASA